MPVKYAHAMLIMMAILMAASVRIGIEMLRNMSIRTMPMATLENSWTRRVSAVTTSFRSYTETWVPTRP